MSDREARTDWTTTSFSEMSTLAACEEKWWLRYHDREESPTGKAAGLGIALHAGTGALWSGVDLATATFYAEAELRQAGIELDEKQRDAYHWIMDRYARHYAEDFKRVDHVEATEVEMVAELPNGIILKARIDQLLVIEGLLVLREAKSSGNKSAIQTASVAPQITLYWWLLEQNGYEPSELWIDHINTYRYATKLPTQKALMETGLTRDEAKDQLTRHPGIERPLADSFTLIRGDRTDEQVHLALEWAQAILLRRAMLLDNPKNGVRFAPIRNIGTACAWCDHRFSCFEGMSFRPEEFHILDESE